MKTNGMSAFMSLRRYFLADDSEQVHWSDYAWLIAFYSLPIAITAYTLL